MIKIDNIHTETYGWVAAIRGMRNPLNSWEKSDSKFVGCSSIICREKECEKNCIPVKGSVGVTIGEEDLKLMKKLVKSGNDHSKFMRFITVTCDITAPLYWWKEFDTYKVGTVANSCSTMHKIADKKFDIDDFSWEHLIDREGYQGTTMEEEDIPWVCLSAYKKGDEFTYSPYGLCAIHLIDMLNICREKYIATKDKKYWWQMIQLLPSSYNQKRTVMLNYAVLRNMYFARRNHKLDEWHDFCKWIESLPYSELITMEE